LRFALAIVVVGLAGSMCPDVAWVHLIVAVGHSMPSLARSTILVAVGHIQVGCFRIRWLRGNFLSH
jgi:hypothetical protein